MITDHLAVRVYELERAGGKVHYKRRELRVVNGTPSVVVHRLETYEDPKDPPGELPLRIELFHRDQQRYPQLAFDVAFTSTVWLDPKIGAYQISARTLWSVIGISDHTLRSTMISLVLADDVFDAGGYLKFKSVRVDQGTIHQNVTLPKLVGKSFLLDGAPADIPVLGVIGATPSVRALWTTLAFKCPPTPVGGTKGNEVYLVEVSRAVGGNEDFALAPTLDPGGVRVHHDGPFVVRQIQSLDHVRKPYDRGRSVESVIHVDGVLSVADVGSLWNSWVAAPYLAALSTVSGGRDLSFLPVLQPPDSSVLGSHDWRLSYRMWDRYRMWHSTPSPVSVPKDPGDRYSVMPARVLNTKPPSGRFKANLASFVDHDGSSFAREVSLVPPEPVGRSPTLEEQWRQSGDQPGEYLFELKLETKKFVGDGKGPLRLARVGALDLAPAASGDQVLRLTLKAKLGNRRLGAKGRPRRHEIVPFVELTATLALDEVRPGGQDPLPDELRAAITATSDKHQALRRRFAREDAVVIPCGSVTGYELLVEERTSPDSTRALRLRLLDIPPESSNNPKDLRVVVIDRHPLFVGLVDMPRLAGSDEGNQVGTWSLSERDGSKWELLGAHDDFDLVLPPQAVGEEMEKGNGWGPDGKPVIPEDKNPIDFRFSPPARFRLRPSYYKQRFVEPSWNLRRILGYAGQRAPGAGLSAMRFELLYGMTGFAYDLDLRLAEIESRMGRPPGPGLDEPRDDEISAPGERGAYYQQSRKDWARLHGGYRSRLGVLLPRADGRSSAPTISEGLHFELRDTAEVEYPLPNVDKEDRAVGFPTRDPPIEHLLRGGAPWGFESNEIVKEVWSQRQPTSDAASLSNPAFSALGGWGFQKASFANGKTRIYSNTAMGRLTYYSLERIGRISVFWNRAKHVIVYERVAAPSAQFADEQPANRGRVLVRKVREYVEILQPRRSYPEFGDAEVTRGCVAASTFGTTVIPVNGRWGEDVDRGWIVPLWRVDVDSRLYPKPQIGLELAADPATGSATVACELAEPEKLYFYTSTDRALDDDTDAWPPARRVDFDDLGVPMPPKESGFSNARPDERLPDPPVTPSGYDRYSYGIVPSGQPVDVMAGRNLPPLRAELTAVTMMRAAPRPQQLVTELGQKARGLREKVSRQAREIESSLARLRGVFDPPGKSLEERLDEETKKLFDEEAEKLASLVTSLDTDIRHLVANPTSNPVIGSWLEQAAETEKRLKDEVDRLLTSGETTLKWYLGKLRDDMAPYKDGLDDAAAIRALEEAIRKHVHPAVVDPKRPLPDGLFRTPIDWFFHEIRRLETAVYGFFARVDEACAALDRVALELQGSLTSEIRARLARTVESVRVVLVSELRRLASAVSDAAEHRLAGAKGLDALERKLREALEVAEQQAQELVQVTPDYLACVKKVAEQASRQVRERLESMQHAIGTYRVQLATHGRNLGEWESTLRKQAAKQANDIVAIINALETELLETHLAGLRKATTSAVATLAGALSPNLPAIRKYFDDLVKDLKAFTPETLLGDAKSVIDKAHGSLPNLASFERRIRHRLGEAIGEVLDQEGAKALRLLHAFGKAPRVPGLDFNREHLGYFFDPDRLGVLVTPTAALVNRVGDQLKALGQRIPVRELLDGLVPDTLERFDLNAIFPDFAGLKLADLFPGLKFPSIASKGIEVKHGYDVQSGTAWLQAEVDVPLHGRNALLNVGALELDLVDARFVAVARLTVRPGQAPRQETRGSLSGDWEVVIGGLRLVTFVDTALTFDAQGRFGFDISPTRIRLPAALQFLADLVKKGSDDARGFTLELVENGGLPTGVRALLDLPVPAVGGGAFAISGLRLGAGIELMVGLQGGGVDFTLAVSTTLGRKSAPFTLSLFILSGGGWFETEVRYSTASKALATRISIGIVAGAAFELALGPLRGGVSILFGVTLEYVANDPLARNGTTVGIMLLIRGEVSVLGIVSVSLSVLLEATYSSNGRLVGRGTVTLKIKLFWCFTLKLSVPMEYVFAEQPKREFKSNAAAAYPLAANDTAYAAEFYSMFG